MTRNHVQIDNPLHFPWLVYEVVAGVFLNRLVSGAASVIGWNIFLTAPFESKSSISSSPASGVFGAKFGGT